MGIRLSERTDAERDGPSGIPGIRRSRTSLYRLSYFLSSEYSVSASLGDSEKILGQGASTLLKPGNYTTLLNTSLQVPSNKNP